ncbi:MAG: hypothetical protein OFPII_12440 [Osedax symbiont Rs1]|nr:MAG: hypothetical protein OFPII_12440 [Osedax symbiont Rs1]
MSSKIPLSTPESDKLRAEQKAPEKGLSGLSSKSGPDDYCAACEDNKIIPIYPLRIAYANLYTEDGVKLTYPNSIENYNNATNVKNSKGFALRKLRKGYVYIFDDTNQIWSIFFFDPEQGKGGSFSKMQWLYGDADEDWATTSEQNLVTAYVPCDASNIWICFSQHRWSHNIFAKAHNEVAFRNQVMTKTNVLAASAEPFLDELSKIADYAEEFSNSKMISEAEWDLLSDINLDIDSDHRVLNDTRVLQAQGKAIICALHDPIGVVSEIAVSHLNRIKLKSDYLDAKMYPLTVANAIDVFQNSAKKNAASATEKERKIYQKWQEAVTPEYKDIITEAENNLRNYEDTVAATLNAWEHFHNMGTSDPQNSLGSLQTHLTTFNPDSELPREINDLLAAAALSIKGISSSKAGQEAIRRAILAKDKWSNDTNIVPKAVRIVTELAKVTHSALDRLRINATAASDLLADLAVPGAFEIVNLKRVDILKDVTKFYAGYVNKSIKRVEQPISNILHEITHGPKRTPQRTKILQRGLQLNRTQVSTGTYTFDGEINLTGQAGYNVVDKLGGLKTGFVMMMNTLNIFTFAQTAEKDQMKGFAGRIANPKFALFLTAIESTTELVALSQRALKKELPASYKVHGKLKGSQLRKLLKVTDLTDDFIKTVAGGNKVTIVKSNTGKLSKLSMLGRIGLVTGLGLAIMDLFSAYEAYRRGDKNALISFTSLGLGAALLALGVSGLFSTTFTGIGIVISIVLIIVGLIYSRWVDDPITKWLKNCFWGTSSGYLYWDDKSRSRILADAGMGSDNYQGQTNVITNNSIKKDQTYDFLRFFQREMQEFNELVYWPQKEKPPADIRAIRTTGWGPFKRTTRMLDTDSNTEIIRFRLPNFVDGFSELDATVMAKFTVRFKQSFASEIEFVDVTQQFFKELKIVDEANGLFESKITLEFDNNSNDTPWDDMYWKIDCIYLKPAWTYSPNSQLTLPIGYYENWTDSGYEFAEEGGQKILTLWGI